VRWFLDTSRTEYKTPLAAHLQAHHSVAPTPRIIHSNIFGRGRIVEPSSDYFDGLGLLWSIQFDNGVSGSFRRDFLELAQEVIA
jgi:hypothetical protein